MKGHTMSGQEFDDYVTQFHVRYDVPDVEPNEETGLSIWTVLGNGSEIGRVVETERYYTGQRTSHGSDPFWIGRNRSFREEAIADVIREFELGD